MTPQPHSAGANDSQTEAIGHARDLLQAAKVAVSAALRAETNTRRTITLARAYDEIGRTLNELADL